MAQSSFAGFPIPKPDKKGINGKRTASGTATSASTASTFTYVDGTTVTTGQYALTVTGLTFMPTLIVLIWGGAGTSNMSIYQEQSFDVYPKLVTMNMFNVSTTSGSGTTRHFKGDVAPASVTSSGFTLPVGNAGVLYNWIAYE